MSLAPLLQLPAGALPFVFLAGVALLRLAEGADRPRAIIDGFLAWAVVSYAGSEFFNLFGQVSFIPFLVLWSGACPLVFLLLWGRRADVSCIPHLEPSLALAIVAVFAAVTLFIALTAAPNNWDSLTYHLPKIEHWVQDRSLAFYPTANPKQNEFSPLAEMLLLQTRVLGGNDRYYPLIQWFSMAASVAAVFRITGQLGGTKAQCWIAALFLVTLPIGILESTSTQNDYVECALLAVFVTLGIEAIDRKNAPLKLIAAASVAGALSGLTKPLGFVAGLGFALWFAFMLGRNVGPRVWVQRLAAAVIVLGLVLGPFTARFIGGADLSGIKSLEMNASFGLKQTADNLIRQVVTDLATGIPRIDQPVLRASESLTYRLGLQAHRADTSDPDFGIYQPPVGRNVLHEDLAPNPVHAVLLMLALIAAAFRWPARPTPRQWSYGAAWLVGIIAFATLKRFALWEVRYHLPGFALAAPIVALAWPVRWSGTRAARGLLLLLAIAGAPALLFNKTRELLPLGRQHYFPQGYDARPILSRSRIEGLFANQPQFFGVYHDAINALLASNATQIGLILGERAWEYPIWALLRDRAPDRSFRIEHVGLPGAPSYPLGPFAPQALFWNTGEGDAPERLVVDGQEFRRIFQSGPIAFHKDTIAVFARVALALRSTGPANR